MFRGGTMAAMVIVNNPGSWSAVFPPLRHADWHGCTPTDLIFPFFLFIVGTAMAMGRKHGASRVVRRTLALFGLGLLLHLSTGLFRGSLNLGDLRIMGVLQRIALCYAAAAAVTRWLPVRVQVLLGGMVLVGHTALLGWWPGGVGGGFDDRTPQGNLAAYLDHLVLTPAHMYRAGAAGPDPEGLLSTFPAVVTVLIGYWCGRSLQDSRQRDDEPRWKSARGPGVLALAGAAGVAAGTIMHVSGWVPLNKTLWTSSYVLFTGGWAAIVLGILVRAVDGEEQVKPGRWRRFIAAPLAILGVNAILLFVGTGLWARALSAIRWEAGERTMSLNVWLYEQGLAWWLPDRVASLAYAGLTLALWWVLLWVCWRRGWMLRV